MGTGRRQEGLGEQEKKRRGSGLGCLSAGRGTNTFLCVPSPRGPSEAKPRLKWWGRSKALHGAHHLSGTGLMTAGHIRPGPSLRPPNAKPSRHPREAGSSTFRSPNRRWSRVSKP